MKLKYSLFFPFASLPSSLIYYTVSAGGVEEDVLVFFSNWACQSGRAVLDQSTDTEYVASVKRHMVGLQDQIIHRRRFFEGVKQVPADLLCLLCT